MLLYHIGKNLIVFIASEGENQFAVRLSFRRCSSGYFKFIPIRLSLVQIYCMRTIDVLTLNGGAIPMNFRIFIWQGFIHISFPRGPCEPCQSIQFGDVAGLAFNGSFKIYAAWMLDGCSGC